MTLSNGPNESCEWPPDPKEHKPQVPSCNSRDAWDHQHHHKLVSSFVFTVYHLELIEKLYKESADEDKIITLLRRKFLENIVYVCISQLAYWLLWILPTKTADEHLEAPWSWLHSQGQNNMHALCRQITKTGVRKRLAYTCLVYSQTHKPGKSLIHREGRDDGERDENSVILPHTSPHTNME